MELLTMLPIVEVLVCVPCKYVRMSSIMELSRVTLSLDHINCNLIESGVRCMSQNDTYLVPTEKIFKNLYFKRMRSDLYAIYIYVMV